MELKKLSELMRKAGIVGAGGAGFPSYAKLNEAADTVILNCAECEPLFKLHSQLLARYANEIMTALCEIADSLGASRAIIAVKPAYTHAVEAVKEQLSQFEKIKIAYLPEIYPAGDEVITIYETTGRIVKPGALPITVGCVVYNVESVYNFYRAWKEDAPVTHKYITIAGEVKTPCTLRVPLGISYGELIKLAGGVTCEDYALIAGGPMTGKLTVTGDVVTKTSNALLVLPKNAFVIQKRLTPVTISTKRAMAACCQCRMCTDLCSRNLLGQPIEPHKVMRAVASGVSSDVATFMGTFSCSSCGLCEMFSCGQGLDPRAIINEVKNQLRKNGITPPKGIEPKAVNPDIKYRKVPMSRLVSRMGLKKYDVPAPLVDVEITSKKVKILLGQGIGAPAVASVKKGDAVKCGDLLGSFTPDKLGTDVHSSSEGVVREVTESYVIIEK